jgi:hypothetical protein
VDVLGRSRTLARASSKGAFEAVAPWSCSVTSDVRSGRLRASGDSEARRSSIGGLVSVHSPLRLLPRHAASLTNCFRTPDCTVGSEDGPPELLPSAGAAEATPRVRSGVARPAVA